MEFGTKSRESSLDESTRESSASDKKKNKKETGSAAIRAEIVAEKTANSEKQLPPEKASVVESIWQKIKGEDMPLFGIDKPEVTPSSPPKVEQPKAEQLADNAELADAAQKYTADRLREAEDELQELPPSELDTPQAAETAATVALMHAVQEKLSQDKDIPVAEAVDDAARDVVEIMNQEDSDEAAPDPDVDSELTPKAGAPEADQEPPADAGEVPPTPPQPPTGPPNQPPNGPPNGPPHGPPNGPPGGANNPNNPGNPNALPPLNPNIAPAAVAAAVAPNVLPAARAAMGKGLLTGGVLGYFFGRHRGRKQGARAAEKEFTPVRKSLENQVKNLEENIATKEQQLRQTAREKFNAVSRGEEQQKFVENLLPPVVAATQPVGELYSRAEPGSAAQAPTELLISQRYQEQTTPKMAEAPAAAVAAPIMAAERLGSAEPMPAERQERPVQAEQIAEKPAEQPKVVPFDKKAEDFSHEELMLTAEKIKVQGVSLKEMAELGRLDERALRRVTQEFLEGGNVSAAVAREIKEKELKFERDPRMRAAAVASGGSALAGAAGGGAALPFKKDATTDKTGAAADGLARNYDGPRPTPDAATLKAIRDKQVATVAGTTVLVVLVLLVLVLLTR